MREEGIAQRMITASYGVLPEPVVSAPAKAIDRNDGRVQANIKVTLYGYEVGAVVYRFLSPQQPLSHV